MTAEDSHSTDDTEQFDVCPKCGETFNHWIDNGYRNSWPRGVEFEVCTTADSELTFVHTQNLKNSWSRDTERAQGDDS